MIAAVPELTLCFCFARIKIYVTLAEGIWNSGSRDIRDLLKEGKIARSAEEVEWLVNLLRKYNVKTKFND
jgi:hypothetical protein